MRDKAKSKRRRPQPTEPKVWAAILKRLSAGESLRKICASRDMPSKARLMELLAEDDIRADQYARARRRGIESHVDEILDLADSATPENAHVARLKIDTLKWLASKLIPKVYGDKIDVTSGDEPLQPAEFTLIEAARAIACVLQLAAERERALPASIDGSALPEPDQTFVDLGTVEPCASDAEREMDYAGTLSRQAEAQAQRPAHDFSRVVHPGRRPLSRR